MLSAQATRTAGRWNIDATAEYTDPDTGMSAWAVTGGVVDSHISHCIAAVTAHAAAEEAATSDTTAGLAAAAQAVADHQAGDACILIARADDNKSGWNLLWAGRVRAYELRNGRLVQLTDDHSVPVADYDPEVAGVPQLSPRHLRTEVTVPTASVMCSDNAGYLHTSGPRQRLLVLTDGVHATVSLTELEAIARSRDDAADCAHALVDAAFARGATGSATALVVDPTAP